MAIAVPAVVVAATMVVIVAVVISTAASTGIVVVSIVIAATAIVTAVAGKCSACTEDIHEVDDWHHGVDAEPEEQSE